MVKDTCLETGHFFMERIQIPANKSNLIRLKEELVLAQEGLELLDQKKEILINRIGFLASKANLVRKEVNQRLLRTYAFLRDALLEYGESSVQATGLGVRIGESVVLRERSLMGVVLPLVRIDLPPHKPGYGFYGTGKSMDATSEAVHRAMEVVAELAELEVGIERLMAELKKTLKRINALAHIYVPTYRATIKAMEETLEEKEREALFQLKHIREKSRKMRTHRR
jgi:V/A-type H+-transporting ATPase subunit D